MTEKQFMAQVIQLAQLCGWMVFHPHDSRRSAPGFPDLTLVRRGGPGLPALLFAELKVGRGKPTPEQALWLQALRLAGATVFLWRPDDWPEIERTLKGE